MFVAGPIVPVGIESSSIIPDAKITAASNAGSQYLSSLARLNLQSDGGGWCASSCEQAQYLQIDLTDEWKISEVNIYACMDSAKSLQLQSSI